MKKISIMIMVLVVALASCKKTPEVNLKYVDVERDLVTVGTTTANIQCDYDYIATLKKAYLFYGEGHDEANMTSTEMRVVQNTLYVELTGLKANSSYNYYYEFHNGFNSMQTALRTFKTEESNGGGEEPPSIVHECVDLGLPSGLLWATCNVGADTPENNGGYFAWAETQPKSTYNWNPYQYCMGSGNTLTKYCNNASYGYNDFTDNLTVLEASDDVATVQWGSGWRMPTKEEWQELYQNTTHIWTTQNGVNGRLFIATNSNSLFLPAAGYRYDSSLIGAGSFGNYWSSSLFTGSPSDAWGFGFSLVNCVLDYNSRYCGQSVRAVRSGQN